MRVMAGVNQIGVQPTVGKLIVGEEFERFKLKTVGERFLFIRTELNRIYPGEYTRDAIRQRKTISVQGLINVEEGKKKTRFTTIELLSNAYELDNLALVTDVDYLNSIEGFLLAKKIDRDQFFRSYAKEHFILHSLDPRGGGATMPMLADGELEIVEIDHNGDDVIHHPDGTISLDRCTIEVTVNLYQTSSGHRYDENALHIHSVISPDDAKHIMEMISKEVRILENRFRQWLQLKEEFDVYRTLTSAEAAILLATDPEERKKTEDALYGLRRTVRNLKTAKDKA